MEKKRAESKIVSRLNVNGTIITEPKEVLIEQKQYYENLYKEKEQTNPSFNFFDERVPKLNANEKANVTVSYLKTNAKRSQFRKLINRYKRICYSLDIMRQTACLVVNPIIVDGYASLFNCTTAVRASDSMTASS